MSSQPRQVDVVVVKAGPVGLMLASELQIAGVNVAALERDTAIDQTIKAGALNIPSVAALYRRGLTPQLQRAHAQNLARFAAFAPPNAAGATRGSLGSSAISAASSSTHTNSTLPTPTSPARPASAHSAWSASNSWNPCWKTAPATWASSCSAASPSPDWSRTTMR